MATETKTLKIAGMHCDMCVKKVTEALNAVDGVRAVEVKLEPGTAEVTMTVGRVDPDALRKAVEGAGYRVEGD